jgi:hypothetical protein
MATSSMTTQEARRYRAINGRHTQKEVQHTSTVYALLLASNICLYHRQLRAAPRKEADGITRLAEENSWNSTETKSTHRHVLTPLNNALNFTPELCFLA